MARRRRPRDTRLGVGGTAGQLGYGERAVVESTAVVPTRTPAVAPVVGPPAAPQQRPVSPAAAAADPFAPTMMPRQPMTAGLEPGGVPENDPVNVLRALYRRFPYPEIRRLIERRDMMSMGPAQRSMNTLGGYLDTAYSDQGDSWMRQDGMRGRVVQNTMNDIRNRQGDSRFEGTDPDRSRMTPEQQAEAERRMDDVRNRQGGGRFESERDPDQSQMTPQQEMETGRALADIRNRRGGRFAGQGD